MTAEKMLITEKSSIQPKQESKFVKSAVKIFGYLAAKVMDFRKIFFNPPANPAQKMQKQCGILRWFKA